MKKIKIILISALFTLFIGNAYAQQVKLPECNLKVMDDWCKFKNPRNHFAYSMELYDEYEFPQCIVKISDPKVSHDDLSFLKELEKLRKTTEELCCKDNVYIGQYKRQHFLVAFLEDGMIYEYLVYCGCDEFVLKTGTHEIKINDEDISINDL